MSVRVLIAFDGKAGKFDVTRVGQIKEVALRARMERATSKKVVLDWNSDS